MLDALMADDRALMDALMAADRAYLDGAYVMIKPGSTTRAARRIDCQAVQR
jgi:hypothetical protein